MALLQCIDPEGFSDDHHTGIYPCIGRQQVFELQERISFIECNWKRS